MDKEFEFKASNVEAAIEKGLKKLELTREQVDIEVLSKEGIFSKAVVKVTPKEVVEKEEETVKVEEEIVKIEEIEELEGKITSQETEEENKRFEENRNFNPRDSRNRRENPVIRKDCFPAEKERGKEIISNIATYFSDKVRVDAKSYEDELCFYIGGEDASVFIGHRGETLDAIQYLAGQIINKERAESAHIRVTVDADFYRERRKKTLTSLAKKLAASAYANKQELSLEPMNSYERRIIHSALQNNEEATTRSEGEGKDRHVVIVPKCEIISYGNVSAEFRKKGPGRTKSYGQKRRKF